MPPSRNAAFFYPEVIALSQSVRYHRFGETELFPAAFKTKGTAHPACQLPPATGSELFTPFQPSIDFP